MATFVLVHGAFLGGWCWKDVLSGLRERGHEAHAPTLTGCGDRAHLLSRDVGLDTHVEDLVQLFHHEGLSDVILVGHSYGGTVITAAARRLVGRVRTLVYLDAQAPRDGETASGEMADGTAERLEELTRGSGWLLPPLPLEVVGITTPELVERVRDRRHDHPMRTLLERVDAPPDAFVSVERSYIACRQHDAMQQLFGVDPLAPFVARAKAEGWRYAELDAPHDAMITAPELVTSALLAHA